MTLRLAVPAHPGDKRDDLPRAPEGRPPGRSERGDRGRQPQRGGAGPLPASRLASARGVALLVPVGCTARAQGAWRVAPQPRRTSRPCISSSSTRRSGRAGCEQFYEAARGRRRRARCEGSRTARSQSTLASATGCVRSATRMGRSRLPGDEPRLDFPAARPPLPTRSTRPRRPFSSRSTASSAPSSACARSRTGSYRSNEARSGQLVDWRVDDAGHDASRARRDRHRRLLARIPSERRRRPRDRDRQSLAGRDDGGARASTPAPGRSA